MQFSFRYPIPIPSPSLCDRLILFVVDLYWLWVANGLKYSETSSKKSKWLYFFFQRLVKSQWLLCESCYLPLDAFECLWEVKSVYCDHFYTQWFFFLFSFLLLFFESVNTLICHKGYIRQKNYMYCATYHIMLKFYATVILWGGFIPVK